MALEYTLELATTRPPAAVLNALLASGHGFVFRDGELVAPGVTAVIAKEPELGREIIRDAYQIDPTVYVKFRLDKFEGWQAGMETTIRATLALLEEMDCDGVLLFNGESVIVLRTGRKLLLNSRHDFWDRSRLPLVGAPYEMRDIRSL